VIVESDRDIVAARMRGRAIAYQLGFAAVPATLITAVISELARNILLYAKRGEILLSRIENGEHRGLSVIARDEGPGIPDVARALQDGYSTSGRLGLGLPGVRRLSDDFQLLSQAGGGTTVKVKIWNR